MDIFNKLNEQPHLQAIIIEHYKSSITKDHIKHDEAMFVKNYLDDKPLIEKIKSIAMDYVRKNYDEDEPEELKKGTYKEKLKQIMKHMKKINGKDLRPIIFLELNLSLKFEIGLCREMAKKRYPNSKRKRERYFQQIYKPSMI